MAAEHLTKHPWRAVIRVAALTTLLPCTAAAQYTVTAGNGDTVRFESAELRTLLDTARALYADLQEDPRVGYFTPLDRQPVSPQQPGDSYPWNVVTVVNDSTADLQRLPANLREADRAYYNYAVQRMRVVRGADPDVPCDSVLAMEEKVVGSFIDGWILSRTLFGGPAFEPLDELVFARHAGLLRPLLARRADRQVGACAGQWAEDNPERIAAYEAWRLENFPVPDEVPVETSAPPDTASAEGAEPS
ncbi:MAG: hypothetical protein Q8W45_08475 [Candidatus Palauibacterales bacterium]|nr:hypothetical protein [Candidatus Palauibacterales bacterium]